ncbi:MAG: sulfotransferase [Actinobacteria bacterium]|nr:sulfotransferase [Actinomycetota bacterium]
MSPEQLDAALSRFKSDVKADRRAASRQLVSDLVDPLVISRAKQRWVETTPRNARRCDSLYRIYPDMKLVNMIRDGRDVAASIVSRGWGSDEFLTALDVWFERMMQAHNAMARIPADQTLTLQLEDLVNNDRETSYDKLFAFLGIHDSNPTRNYFEAKMNSENGHLNRWVQSVDPSMRDTVTKKYAEMLARLDDAGVTRPH